MTKEQELQNQYNTLISKYKLLKLTRKENPELTLENHHILPTSLGGGNDPDNLVMLPASKHFEAHSLLADMGTKQMIKAFWWMCQTMMTKGVEVTAEEYEKGRELFVESMTGENHPMYGITGENHPMFGITGEDHPNWGKKRTPEQKAAQSAAMMGKNNHMFGKTREDSPHWGREHTAEFCAGKAGSKNPNYDHTIYSFIHKDGSTFTGTQYELRMKYKLNVGHLSSVIKGTRNHHKGWHLVK